MINFAFFYFFCILFLNHCRLSFCDAPLSGSLASAEAGLASHCLDSFSFQDPASPLMEGIIALHSDIWALMLFVAGFVLYMLCAILYNFSAQNTNASYKVHHHSLIEIIWTTIPAIILCLVAIPSFTLLYSLDEIVEPSLTVKAIGRQWYWSAPFHGDLDWKINCIGNSSHLISYKQHA
jgi:cytochrome c oxidase subunit 2